MTGKGKKGKKGSSRGGARRGAGRKPSDDPAQRKTLERRKAINATREKEQRDAGVAFAAFRSPVPAVPVLPPAAAPAAVVPVPVPVPVPLPGGVAGGGAVDDGEDDDMEEFDEDDDEASEAEDADEDEDEAVVLRGRVINVFSEPCDVSCHKKSEKKRKEIIF